MSGSDWLLDANGRGVQLQEFPGHPEHPVSKDDPLGQMCRVSCQDALNRYQHDSASAGYAVGDAKRSAAPAQETGRDR